MKDISIRNSHHDLVAKYNRMTGILQCKDHRTWVSTFLAKNSPVVIDKQGCRTEICLVEDGKLDIKNT